MGKIIKWLIDFFKKLLRPVVSSTPMATDVVNDHIIIIYNKQRIDIRKNELQQWAAMPRKDKRGMARRFETLEKKGLIMFQKINGKTMAIWAKDYEARIKNKDHAEKTDTK